MLPFVRFLSCKSCVSPSYQKQFHWVSCILATGIGNDPAPGRRRQTKLLTKTAHNFEVGLGDRNLRHLLPVAGRRFHDGSMPGDEFFGFLPPGIRLTVSGKSGHIHFSQDAEVFQLPGGPSPFLFRFGFQPHRTFWRLLHRFGFIFVELSFSGIAFQLFDRRRFRFSAGLSH